MIAFWSGGVLWSIGVLEKTESATLSFRQSITPLIHRSITPLELYFS
jgi:hypothetical protein